MSKRIVILFCITSILLFILIKLFAIYSFEYVPNRMATIWKLQSNISKNYRNNMPLNIIVGSSRTLALKPHLLESLSEQKFMNLSAPSAKIPYVYYTLKRIIDNNVKVNNIYIDIPASNNIKLGEFEVFLRYFINENELKEYKLYSQNSEITYDNTRKFGKNYVTKDLSVLLRGYLFKKNENKLYRDILINNLGYTLIGDPNRKSNKNESLKYRKIIENLTKNEVPKIQEIYLKKIIDLLETNNISYKFFFSPFPKISKKVPNLGLGNYINLLNIIPSQNINLNSLLLEEDLFIDGSHPNLKGKDEFNKYFAQEILGVKLNEQFELYSINIKKAKN